MVEKSTEVEKSTKVEKSTIFIRIFPHHIRIFPHLSACKDTPETPSTLADGKRAAAP